MNGKPIRREDAGKHRPAVPYRQVKDKENMISDIDKFEAKNKDGRRRPMGNINRDAKDVRAPPITKPQRSNQGEHHRGRRVEVKDPPKPEPVRRSQSTEASKGSDHERKHRRSHSSSTAKDQGNKTTKSASKGGLLAGDMVRIKNTEERGKSKSNNVGEVMFVGPANFANGRTVVGLKLQHKRNSSKHDGKEKGERYFRCDAGFGCYVLIDDVEKMNGSSWDSGSNDKPSKPFDLEKSLDGIIGLEKVKVDLRSLRNRLEVGRRRAVFGVQDNKPMHMRFEGSDGMDFESVAKVLAGLLHHCDALPTSNVVVLGKKDLVAGSTADTQKLVKEKFGGTADPKGRKGRGCAGSLVLVNDCLGVVPKADGGKVSHLDRENTYVSVAMAQLGVILEEASKKKGDTHFVVVFAGTKGIVDALLGACPNVADLFTPVQFDDYDALQLVQLMRQSVTDHNFTLHKKLTDDKLKGLLVPEMSRVGFEGGGKLLVDRVVEGAIRRQTDRVYTCATVSRESLLCLTEADFSDVQEAGSNADEALATLNNVIGLSGVKTHIHSLVAQLMLGQKRRMAGLSKAGQGSGTLHMIFTGNPGTGKTTVARMVADILHGLGYLKTNKLVETDRSGLVAPYCGQTAIKTSEVVRSAVGGMLFVDEAYSLVKDTKDSFGKEALDTLIKLVEDLKDNLVVVLAGYTKEMEELLTHNPGVS
jgi:hypothetical protein